MTGLVLFEQWLSVDRSVDEALRLRPRKLLKYYGDIDGHSSCHPGPISPCIRAPSPSSLTASEMGTFFVLLEQLMASGGFDSFLVP